MRMNPLRLDDKSCHGYIIPLLLFYNYCKIPGFFTEYPDSENRNYLILKNT